MRVERFDWDGTDAPKLARELRALQPGLGEVTEAVAEIISAVGAGGDEAVIELERRFGGTAAERLQVSDEAIRTAESSLGANPELRSALELAISNLRAVAEAEAGADRESEVELAAGQVIAHRSVPVAAAGAYVPGGRAPYPSTAIMCCVPARAAGVDRVVVASPAGPDGLPDPLVLAAASLAGASEVYAMGGAQAIAALALGTETIRAVDVIVGPGNRFVQEAKRQLYGRVGLDGLAGPSELMAVVDDSVELRRIALDLCAQAEHADDGLLIGCAADGALLDRLEELIAELPRDRATVQDAPLALVTAPSVDAAVELVNAVAPEHLELACDGAEVLAQMIPYAGCVFLGAGGATAFGDYAAGSNHVLPTGGAGRFSGPLGPGTFVRRVPTVNLDQRAARELAPAVATLARAEGFPVHAESAEARMQGRSADGRARDSATGEESEE